ncbi:TlyA family RNA methyltransferase [Neomoorella mulderi]|uniref:16S/23S rRNA (Cytidine-2'-O)-methyltransferase TlyA n=1 Tax=Moorella mulderi DSM 14980 TaxID=1122241 RepID=A0A151AW62_9FIRM|nr:TlyA family RNA methyltransferase [Moorella mulderi]KYH31647.1 16S/23S rRNA (cytidine-2'-O)-methyltransferase TlyA [Moorella mulderi DSM 14980]
MARQRLDLLLVQRGLFASRQQARAAIMAGEVLVNNVLVDKPGEGVPVDAEIRLTGQPLPYVSRGGLKLEKALKVFNIDLRDKIILDVGASTGGFTDCALKHGAARVYAVDVGYGQLAWSLRQDPRVTVLERTNARYLERDTLGELVDVATIDVAFISLAKILPAVLRCLKPEGEIIALVKPQFEAGPGRVGKKGVVRDPAVHREVLKEVMTGAAGLGLKIYGLTCSPISGPEGNLEFLLWLGLKGQGLAPGEWQPLIEQVVAEAHQEVR